MTSITTEDGAEIFDRDFGEGLSELSSRSAPGLGRLDAIENRPVRSVVETDNRDFGSAPTSHALFITPTRWGDGFKASIHGHMLELADPDDHRLAPSPDDLLIASIASNIAWIARRFLRAHGLPDDASVSARWRASEALPTLTDIELTVTVSKCAEAVGATLAAAFANSLAARSLADADVQISYEE